MIYRKQSIHTESICILKNSRRENQILVENGAIQILSKPPEHTNELFDLSVLIFIDLLCHPCYQTHQLHYWTLKMLNIP